MKNVAIIVMVLLSNYSCNKNSSYEKDKKHLAIILDACIAELNTYTFVEKFDSILLGNYITEYNKENYVELALKMHSTSNLINLQEYYNYDSLSSSYLALSYKECLSEEYLDLDREVYNNLSSLIELPYAIKAEKNSESIEVFISSLSEDYFRFKEFRHFVNFCLLYYYVENIYEQKKKVKLPQSPSPLSVE